MQIRIILSQFFRDLKAQKLRTGLTLFGLGWGTFCVVILLSFGEGIHIRQRQDTASTGDRNILVWGSRTSLPYEGIPQGRAIRLQGTDADAILTGVSGVTESVAEYQGYAPMRGPGGESATSISGVTPGYGPIRKVEPEPGGRFLNDTDQRERRRVAFLGSQVREDLFGDLPAIGGTIEIRGIPFLVVGTMARKRQNSNYSGPDDRKVFIPSSVATASLGIQRPNNLVVEVAEGVDGKQAVGEIRGVLARRHRFDPSDDAALTIWDMGETIAMFDKVFTGFRAFLMMVGVFTLAVAGIGVANIMSMVIEDRTSQIGISMALGARRGWVLTQVLLETLLVTLIGGGLGAVLSAAVIAAASMLPIEQIGTPVLSMQTTLLTAGVLGIIGIIAGMGPARRAAHMRPAEALRS